MTNKLTSTETDKFCFAIDHNNEKSLTRLISRYGTEKTMGYTGGYTDDRPTCMINATPILYAVRQKKPLMVDLILRYPGTNVDARTSNGETSLYIACCSKEPCTKIIISLLNRNADVNLANNGEQTPLMMSSQVGNVVVMNLLITAGANIDALDDLGYTALIYAIMCDKPDPLNVLLCCNAKLNIPTCPAYNPLAFAVDLDRDGCVDVLIPYCKIHKNFGEALMGAILRNRFEVFQKLIMNGAKLPVVHTKTCLERVIFDKHLAHFFDLLWPNINHEDYLNSETFAMLIYYIFTQRDRVSFFKSSLKMIMNTPVFNCILTGYREHLVISTIFLLCSDPDYDWTLGKDILLDFCEYINKLGIKLRSSDLITFVHYFSPNRCPFLTELLAIFFKYSPDLVKMYDVIILSRLNDLKLTSLLLYNCSDFNLNGGSIYELDNAKEFSEDMLKFFLRRFTPTKSDMVNIRSFKKFDNINIESLNVPSLMELARNSIRKTTTNSQLKELIKNLNISSVFGDILYFKTIINYI